MKILISSNKWFLRGTLPHIPLNGKSARDISNYYVTDKIPATVPGGVHLDLFNAGIIENPYVEQNSRKCEWVENRWWIYETNLKIELKSSKRIMLTFEGLDYHARIYINDELAGEHENMFTAAKLDITKLASPITNIKVVFMGVPHELGQYGKTSETVTQKSRFNYGWDFAVRLVNIGIWQDVFIEYLNDIELESMKITSDYVGEEGIVDTELCFKGDCDKEILVKIFDPEGNLYIEEKFDFENNFKKKFNIENPMLWYPNGMGEQPLYKLCFSCDGITREQRVGIRSLRYLKNAGAEAESIPYTVVINNQNVYLKGVNKVPLDHLYGNVDKRTYEWYVKAMSDQGINIVRVWGGGIIERGIFYELCDQYGIMIWQDFIQSSSGIENMPSLKKEFLEKLSATATESVLVKRNHVSLTFWCGGNELTDENGEPVALDNKNISMLKDITESLDPQRLFLPSTPSGPVYRLEFENPNNQDVHGPWDYLGCDMHYKEYNRLRLMLHSEFGISSPAADTEDFLLNRPHNSLQHKGWGARTHHGEYWWHSYERDKEIFGEFGTQGEYAPYGQWLQGEGLRYIIESERRKAPYCSGSMIWQLNEPWPNVDCTNLIDYFGNPKLAYYWTKDAFSDFNFSLKYEDIYQGECLNAELFAYCPTGEVAVTCHGLDGARLNTQIFSGGKLPIALKVDLKDLTDVFFVRLSSGSKHKDYFFSKTEKTPYSAARMVAQAELCFEISKVRQNRKWIQITTAVKNTSGIPALFVHPYDGNNAYAILADDAYFTLLPQEERMVNLILMEKTGLFFKRRSMKYNILFQAFNSGLMKGVGYGADDPRELFYQAR